MAFELGLRGRHVVVFGGSSGINLGIAAAFVRQGSNVTVVSRQREKVDAAVAQLSRDGGQAYGCCADVRDAAAVAAAFALSVERFGLVDTVVSGAAGNFLCEANRMSPNGFKTVVDIDLIGTFHVMRQSWPHLRKPGASLINISAPQAYVPMRSQAHAAAAKAGVDQLTRVLALEWGGAGVRVNAISPGPIDATEGFERLMGQDAELRASSIRHVPLQRLGTLDDVADLALFLASDRASWISGAIIPCDGGGALDSVKPALEAAALAERAKSDQKTHPQES